MEEKQRILLCEDDENLGMLLREYLQAKGYYAELLARTKPTIYDVFIAFFGGLAGILASSRKQEKITVVSGVAIATAFFSGMTRIY